MSGSIFDALGGIGANPLVQGLLGLGAGFGQAAGPSRMPVPLGAAFGAGAQGLMGGLTNAAKLRMLMEQEKRLGTQDELARQQMELQRADFDRKRAIEAKMGEMAGQPDPLLGGSVPSPGAPVGTGLQANVVRSESGGNPAAMNAQGYAGMAQMGAPLVADIGMYQRGPNEVFGGQLPGGWGGAKWSGTFNIPGHPDVKTVQDFLAKPAAQQVAYDAAMARNDQQLKASGAYEHIGQTINGIPVTREGLLKGAWLGGVGGVTSWLKSDGTMDRADANGTKISAYVASGAQAAQPQGQAQPAAAQPTASPVSGGTDRYYQLMAAARKWAAIDHPTAKAWSALYAQAAKTALEIGAYQDGTDSAGRPGQINRVTGKFEYAPTDMERVRQPDLSEVIVPRHQAGGMVSAPAPMAPVPTLGPNGPRLTDPANPQRPIGTPLLSNEEQAAAAVQSGQRGVTPSQAITQGAASRAGAETIAKNTAEEWKTTRAAAMDAGQRVAVLDRVEQALGNFPPGALADKKLWLGQMASQMGLPDLVNASEGEILKGLRSRVQLALTPRGQGQITESERGLIGAQFEVMMSTPQGAREMIGMIRRLDQIDMDVAKIYADNAERNGGAPNPIEVQREVQAYLQANPKPVVPNVAPQQAPSRAANRRWNVQKGAWE